VEEEVVRGKRDPRREESIPPDKRTSGRPESLVPDVTALAPSEPPPEIASIVTNRDPRLEQVESALRVNDWDGVLRALGPADEAGKLPPNLGLIYAIARKEKETTESKGSDATEIAIRCAAGLLGVTADSPLALVVAKRIVRKNPVAWQKAPAPPARVSAIIMLIALVIGGAIGWLVATGRVRFHF
jgi:hypothetical protein